MFSDHLPKIDQTSSKALFAVAAGLIILCQLVAMAFVVDGQVKKAHARNALHASERMAVAYCIESSTGVARNTCIAQAQASARPFQDIDRNVAAQAVASVSALESTAMRVPQGPGFMPVALGVR